MPRKVIRVIAFLLCFSLLFEQSGFAQIAGQIDFSGYIAQLSNTLSVDKFRPLHLRSLSYDNINNNFKLLLDKGNLKEIKQSAVNDATAKLLEYFSIGVSLPNESFWVNLRPDTEDQIIDDLLAKTDLGKVLLEADLLLKKDTAKFTSPATEEGKEYWDRLYAKAGELFGSSNITIPTLTRPWIVPDEIIIRESKDNAYVYKATMKVMLEQDYLKDSAVYNFKDERMKELNEYSSVLIRELIIPKLSREINTAKRYAGLRQVYYSLILAQWFKARFYGKGGLYSWLIDRRNLAGLTSKESWSKTNYFKEYQKSFRQGEYNFQEPVTTPYGQVIRSYFSGGVALETLVPRALNPGPSGVATVTLGPSGGSVTDISGSVNIDPSEIAAEATFPEEAEGGTAQDLGVIPKPGVAQLATGSAGQSVPSQDQRTTQGSRPELATASPTEEISAPGAPGIRFTTQSAGREWELLVETSSDSGSADTDEERNRITDIMTRSLSRHFSRQADEYIVDLLRRCTGEQGISLQDLSRVMRIRFYNEGNNKHVFMLAFENRDGSEHNVVIVAKVEKSGARPAITEEMELLMRNSGRAGLPRVGGSFKTIDERDGYFVEFIPGESLGEIEENDSSAPTRAHHADMAALAMLNAYSALNGRAPTDIHRYNFINRTGTDEAVLIDFDWTIEQTFPELFLRVYSFFYQNLPAERDPIGSFIKVLSQYYGQERARQLIEEAARSIEEYISNGDQRREEKIRKRWLDDEAEEPYYEPYYHSDYIFPIIGKADLNIIAQHLREYLAQLEHSPPEEAVAGGRSPQPEGGVAAGQSSSDSAHSGEAVSITALEALAKASPGFERITLSQELLDLVHTSQLIDPKLLDNLEVLIVDDSVMDDLGLTGPAYSYKGRIFIRRSQALSQDMLTSTQELSPFARVIIHELVARHLASRQQAAAGEGPVHHWAARNLEQQLELGMLLTRRTQLEDTLSTTQDGQTQINLRLELATLQGIIDRLKQTHQQELASIEAQIAQANQDKDKGILPQKEDYAMGGGAGAGTAQVDKSFNSFMSKYDLDQIGSLGRFGLAPWRISAYDLGENGSAVAIDKEHNQILINTRAIGKESDEKMLYLVLQAAVQIDIREGSGYYVKGIQRFLSIRSSFFEKMITRRAVRRLIEESPFRIGQVPGTKTQIPRVEAPGLIKPAVTTETKKKVLQDFFANGSEKGDSERIDLALANFEQEIDAAVEEVKAKYLPQSPHGAWEALARIDLSGVLGIPGHPFRQLYTEGMGENKLLREVIYDKWSEFFRYDDVLERISRGQGFKNLVRGKLREFSSSGQVQTIDIGVTGAAYGQEPITAFVYFTREINKIIAAEGGSPQGAVVVRVHVISYPDRVYDRVKNNRIVFPRATIEEAGFTKKEIADYFEEVRVGEELKGYRRSSKLNSCLEFDGVDLANVTPATTAHLRGRLDIFFLHKVLQYVPLKSESERRALSDYLDSLLKVEGILSIIGEDGGVMRVTLADKYHDYSDSDQGIVYVKAGRGLGAQFGGDLEFMDMLIFHARLFWRLQNGASPSSDISPRQLVEFFLAHLRRPTEEPAEARLAGAAIEGFDAEAILRQLPPGQQPRGKVRVRLLSLPENDKLAQRFRERVLSPEGGIRAINFQNSDGTWTVVILKEDLENNRERAIADLRHEFREICFVEQGLPWLEAHRRARILETTTSILTEGLRSPAELRGEGESVVRGSDVANESEASPVIHVIGRPLNGIKGYRNWISQFFRKFLPAALRWRDAYDEYIEKEARDLLNQHDEQRSPVSIMAERPPMSLMLDRVVIEKGLEVAQGRLKNGAVVLMSTNKSTRELEQEAIHHGGEVRSTGIHIGLGSIAPEMIEAIFVPEELFDAISSALPAELRSKVIRVEGQMRACDFFDRVSNPELMMPNWVKAISDFISRRATAGPRTFLAHGVRFPTIEDLLSGRALTDVQDQIGAAHGAGESAQRRGNFISRIIQRVRSAKALTQLDRVLEKEGIEPSHRTEIIDNLKQAADPQQAAADFMQSGAVQITASRLGRPKETAGAKGLAVSEVNYEEIDCLEEILSLLGRTQDPQETARSLQSFYTNAKGEWLPISERIFLLSSLIKAADPKKAADSFIQGQVARLIGSAKIRVSEEEPEKDAIVTMLTAFEGAKEPTGTVRSFIALNEALARAQIEVSHRAGILATFAESADPQQAVDDFMQHEGIQSLVSLVRALKSMKVGNPLREIYSQQIGYIICSFASLSNFRENVEAFILVHNAPESIADIAARRPEVIDRLVRAFRNGIFPEHPIREGINNALATRALQSPELINQDAVNFLRDSLRTSKGEQEQIRLASTLTVIASNAHPDHSIPTQARSALEEALRSTKNRFVAQIFLPLVEHLKTGSVHSVEAELNIPDFNSLIETLVFLADNFNELLVRLPGYVNSLAEVLSLNLRLIVEAAEGDVERVYPPLWEARDRLIALLLSPTTPEEIRRQIRVMIKLMPHPKDADSGRRDIDQMRDLALRAETEQNALPQDARETREFREKWLAPQNGGGRHNANIHTAVHNVPGKYTVRLCEDLISVFQRLNRPLSEYSNLLELHRSLVAFYNPSVDSLSEEIQFEQRAVNLPGEIVAGLQRMQSALANPRELSRQITAVRQLLNQRILNNPAVSMRGRVRTYLFDLYLENLEFASYSQAIEELGDLQTENLPSAVELLNSLIGSLRLSSLWPGTDTAAITPENIKDRLPEVSRTLLSMMDALSGIREVNGEASSLATRLGRFAERNEEFRGRLARFGQRDAVIAKLTSDPIRESALLLLSGLVNRIRPLVSATFILHLEAPEARDVSLAGGKNASLAELAALPGVRTAKEGFIITSDAFDIFIQSNRELVALIVQLNGLSRQWATLNSAIEGAEEADRAELTQRKSAIEGAISQVARKIQELIGQTRIPEQIESEIIREHERLAISAGNAGVFVRSSGTTEDSKAGTSAGQYKTEANLKGIDNVLAGVKSCWASLFNEGAIFYRLKMGLGRSQQKMSVGVYRTINAQAAGVAYNVNPKTKANEMYAQANYGLGESVVSGLVTPETWRVAEDGAILESDRGSKQQKVVCRPQGGVAIEEVAPEEQNGYALSRQQVTELSDTVKIIAEHYRTKFGYAHIDVEFAFEKETGNLYILQVRPLQVGSLEERVAVTEADSASSSLPKGTTVFRGGEEIWRGRPSGKLVVIEGEQRPSAIPKGSIVVIRNSTPDWTLLLMDAGGIIYEIGGAVAHAAQVAREFKIPCLGSANGAIGRLGEYAGREVVLDTANNRVLLLEENEPIDSSGRGAPQTATGQIPGTQGPPLGMGGMVWNSITEKRAQDAAQRLLGGEAIGRGDCEALALAVLQNAGFITPEVLLALRNNQLFQQEIKGSAFPAAQRDRILEIINAAGTRGETGAKGRAAQRDGALSASSPSTLPSQVNISVGAPRIIGNNTFEANVNQVEEFLKQNPNIDLLVTPEYSFYDRGGFDQIGQKPIAAEEWIEFNFKSANEGYLYNGTIKAKTAIDRLLFLAKSYRTNIVLGTVREKSQIDGQDVYFNAAIVIDNSGKIVHIRRKTTGSDWCTIGDNDHAVPQQLANSSRVTSVLPTVKSIVLRDRQNQTFSIFVTICADATTDEAVYTANQNMEADLFVLVAREGDAFYTFMSDWAVNGNCKLSSQVVRRLSQLDKTTEEEAQREAEGLGRKDWMLARIKDNLAKFNIKIGAMVAVDAASGFQAGLFPIGDGSNVEDLAIDTVGIAGKVNIVRPGDTQNRMGPHEANVPTADSVTSSTSLPSVTRETTTPGGIDFRQMPIMTQPISSPQFPVHSPQLSKADLNLDSELLEIRNMIAGGIIPSSQRLKEYLEASCQSQDCSKRIEKILSCIASILRLEEDRVCSTDPALKAFLVLLESDKPVGELQAALSKIEISAKEPGLME